ncbi:hypothetical protein H5P36_20320 [Bacillus sp. APMAM]|uniref:hypothetical protein n=1 Tax=Margalitia sp. FSL K6-0131 TaxID=2954604 RepID=UPI00160166F4|nr:hypothetical protein [Bacillus sp. APMAM]
MTFKKAFNIGYFIFLLTMMIVYFFIPAERKFPVILMLTVVFGLYQFIFLFYKKRVS